LFYPTVPGFYNKKTLSGKHKIGIVVNGEELAAKEFMLMK
jgi:hypothetical protein